jgi:hypothetical protein
MYITIIKTLITVFSGLGIGKLLDKFAADKVPEYPPEGVVSGLSLKKMIFFAIAAVVGTILVKFLGKKLNIKILK